MFILNIPASTDALSTIKSELTNSLSDVKSSHRCEAIARGLGFRTYAAAIAATKLATHRLVNVQGDLFAKYLETQGFKVRSELLYRAAAKVALDDVSKRTPELTAWGIGVGCPRQKQDGSWENFQDMEAKFRQERAELISDHAVESFLASLAFVQQVKPTKTIRQGTSSYWLKHIAENYASTYPDGAKLGPTYVPNGVLIAAALYAGFKIKTYVDEMGYIGLNVSFNMSKPCLEDLDCEIRPNGARAQDRRRREEMKRYRNYPFETATLR